MRRFMRDGVSITVLMIAIGALPAFAQTVTSTPAVQTTEPVPQATEEATVAAGGENADAQEIVVTGIRRSLADAAAIKRNATVISDVISAEDIGKFPDQNIAESLQRVTGVQITRNKGEGQSVSVRGLSADFTRTQYNGRTIPTPASGRSFSFTSLSSDFVSAVEVFKTPSADMIDGGLSATVNVRVARPLDAGRSRTALTAEGIYESNPDKLTPHVSAFTNQILADGAIGVNFGVNYERRRVLQAGYTAYGIETRAENPTSPQLDYNGDGQYSGSYRFNHATTFVSDEGTFERLSLVGGVQAKVLDNVTVYADGFFARFTDDYTRYEHQLRWTNIAGPGAGIRNREVGADNLLTFLDADGVDHRGGTRPQKLADQTISLATGAKAELGKLTLTGEFSWSKARRLDTFINASLISRASASYDMRDALGEVPVIGYGRGYNPLDPSTYRLVGIGGRQEAPTRDKNRDIRLDAVYDIDSGIFSAVRAGGYFGRARKSYQSANFNFTSDFLARQLGVPFAPGIENGSIDGSPYMIPIDRERFISGGLGSFLIPDYDRIFANRSFDDLLAASPVFRQIANDYSVSERVMALYARADFRTPDEAITGNIGVRYVNTSQRSDGAAPDLSQAIVTRDGVGTLIPAATPTSALNKYDNWLPSLNVRWEIAPSLIARVGAARAMTRPELSRLTPSVNINANVRTITQGNPLLRPFLADQFDLSLEYYLKGGGLISAAAFYKDIKNFIVNTERFETLTLQREGGGSVSLDFNRSQPDNGAGGKIKGIEFGVQLPLTFLPGVLNGLGVLANATLLDVGKVQVREGGPLLPISGVSDRSYNVGGYYEKGGFGLRGSYNFRSGFVNSITSNFGDGDYSRGYGQLDVSGSYDVSDRLSFTLDVTNLNKAKQATENSFGVLRTEYDFGRRVTGGVRMKL